MATQILRCTDNSIVSHAPTTNYSASTYLLLGESNALSPGIGRWVVNFAGLTDGTIPLNATIQSAVLELEVNADYSSNARNFRWYRLKRSDISIAQCTWNIYKTGSNWATAGGFGANDCEQTDIGVKQLSATESVGSKIEWNLTPSAIQEIVNGTWTANFLLGKADTETDDGYFFNTNDSVAEDDRPKLTVTYTVPGGTQVIII